MILILEDNRELAFLIHETLRRQLGQPCFSTASVEEAERHVLSGQISLIVSDLELKNKSGIAFLRKLHRILSRTCPPIIVFTGLPSEDKAYREAQRYTDIICEKGETSLPWLGQLAKRILK